MTQNTSPKITSTVLENGIVENYVPSRMLVDSDDLIKLKKNNQKLMGGNPYCVLLTGGRAIITKEAREMAAAQDFIQITIAMAIVVDTKWSRIFANLYLRVNKPKMETRIFEVREEAIEWLRLKLNKSEQNLG